MNPGVLTSGINSVLGRLVQNVRSFGYSRAAPLILPDASGEFVLDWKRHDVQRVKLVGNVTSSVFLPPIAGFGRLILLLEQDSTGSRTFAWPTDVSHDRAATPVLSSAAGSIDRVGFEWDPLSRIYRATSWIAT